MKILFTRFPLESAFNGGAELQTISLMMGLRERGHEVVFAGSCPALLTLCREHGIATLEWDIGAPPVTKWHAISFFWRKRHMKESLKKLSREFFQDGSTLDVIVMLSLNAKLLLTDIAVRAGVKAVWIEHDRVGNWLRKNPWLPMLLRESRTATTIVVSELSRRIYLELGWHDSNLVVIPNGVDTQRLHVDAHSTNPITDNRSPITNLRIGCISRLSPEKGVDVLIAAVATLADVHLEIIGTGRDEARLTGLVRASNIADMVTFTTHEETIGNAYQRIDVLVLPSRDHDPFGLVAAEAMMMGIPVIVTDQCGIASYLRNEVDALIVEANSPSALRQALQSMHKKDVRERIAKAGKKTAEDLFTVNKMVEQYENVLKKAD